ncbi:hypothetical protein WDW89_08005 [Deltaproteobacteria bacterium TL4]
MSSDLQIEEIDGKHYIKGVINERCDFVEFFKTQKDTVTLHMGSVRRINSTGVRRWTEGLNEFPGLVVILEECPREIIDQCNMIPEFMGKKRQQVRIASFYAHYYDEETDEEEILLFKEGEHYRFGEGIIKEPEVPEGMELDDFPDKYFSFLRQDY